MKATGLLPYIEQTDGTLTINTESGYDPNNPYEGRDPRFYATILYDGAMWMGRETETFEGGLDSPESSIQPWNASLTGYALKKFLNEDIPPVGNTERPTNPWIYFRYAEILLNYAEAEFELGNEDVAREYLSNVRNRESVKMPPVTDSGEKLRERIYNERMVELAYEEHRIYDVRRWVIGDQVYKPIHIVDVTYKLNDDHTTSIVPTITPKVFETWSWDNKAYFFPIMRTEMNKNSLLVQNPGY